MTTSITRSKEASNIVVFASGSGGCNNRDSASILEASDFLKGAKGN